MPNWWPLSNEATWWMTIASAVMFFATIAAIPILVAQIPADYFTRDHASVVRWFDRHPAVRITVLVLKNLLGLIFVLAGLAMLVLPGQGVLTILFGVMLLNFPYKRDFELWLVRRRGVCNAVNWLRRKAERPPLQMPAENSDESM